MKPQLAVKLLFDDLHDCENTRTIYYDLVRLEKMLNRLSARETHLPSTAFRCSLKKKT